VSALDRRRGQSRAPLTRPLPAKRRGEETVGAASRPASLKCKLAGCRVLVQFDFDPSKKEAAPPPAGQEVGGRRAYHLLEPMGIAISKRRFDPFDPTPNNGLAVAVLKRVAKTMRNLARFEVGEHGFQAGQFRP
jgi:hypothetical protein